MNRKSILLSLILILILITAFCYQGAIGNYILEWDDYFYIQENPHIRSLNMEDLKRIFTTPYSKNYTPFHLFSYLLDHLLWNDNYLGFHLTNLWLHLLNGLLLFLLIYLWTQNMWIAFLVSAVFLIHPVHVESVAWLSERKGLLAGLFSLMTLLSYDQLKKTGKRRFYISALFLFLFGVLSKPVVVTLPLILILLDISIYHSKTPFSDLVPFFILSIFSLITTLWAQSVGGGIKTYVGGHFLTSILAIPYILFRYVARMIWPYPPFRLSCRYVIWPERFLAPGPMIVTIIILFSFITLYARFVKKREWLGILGCTWFFILLLPVLNFVPTSTQMADRYLYLPAMGIYLLSGALLSKWILWVIQKRAVFGRCLAILIPVFLILFYGVKTRQRAKIWRSDETLWKNALREDPQNYYAPTYLANFYLGRSLKTGDQDGNRIFLDQAQTLFRDALDIAPGFAQANLGLASTLIQKGLIQKAFPLLKKALKTNTEPLLWVRINYNLGVAFMHSEQTKEAEYWLNKAIKVDKGFKQAYLALGSLYMDMAEKGTQKDSAYALAEMIYQEMIQRFPDEFKGYFSLAVLRNLEGKVSEAQRLYQRAISIPLPEERHTEKAQAHINLGILYQEQGQYDRALLHYEDALRIAPNLPTAAEIRRVIYEIKATLYYRHGY